MGNLWGATRAPTTSWRAHARVDRVHVRRRASLDPALDGVPPEAYFWLGEVTSAVDTPAARTAYERYIALAPSGEFVARARRAIAP